MREDDHVPEEGVRALREIGTKLEAEAVRAEEGDALRLDVPESAGSCHISPVTMTPVDIECSGGLRLSMLRKHAPQSEIVASSPRMIRGSSWKTLCVALMRVTGLKSTAS